MSQNLGDIALGGEAEYLPSHIFDAVEEDRLIGGRGTLIMIYNPSAPNPPYWKHTNPNMDDNSLVPAGYKVKVIDGRVKMTKIVKAIDGPVKTTK